MAQLTGPNGYSVGDSEQRDTVQKEILGQFGLDKSGNQYRYVKAGAVIAVNSAVRFNGSALGFDDVRATSATQQTIIGVALTAFALNEFGWVLTRGVGSVLTSGALAAGVGLASSAVAGQLAASAAVDTNGMGGTVLVNSASPQVSYIHAL